MSRQSQGPLTTVGIIAAGIFLVALLALMVLGDYGFWAAVFLAVVIALLAAIVLYLGFGGSGFPSVAAPPAAKSAPDPKPAAAQKGTDVPKAAAAAAPKPTPVPEPASGVASARGDDFDGDGVIEGTGEGTRPAGLDAPRSGGADDLKQIKGIGPKLETLCNSLGFWHFDQIASWTADEVAWVDANLKGFKGRVSRDDWIEQARVLSSGGETEFSKRVEDGDVY